MTDRQLAAILVEVEQQGTTRTLAAILVELEQPPYLGTLTQSLTQAQSVSLVAEVISGSYACLETFTYGGLEAYTYGQLQAGAACTNTYTLTGTVTQGQALSLSVVRAIARSLSQSQSVALRSLASLSRTLPQAQSLQVRLQVTFQRTVSAIQAQTQTLSKAIRLFRRIPQQQNTPLVSRAILHSRQYKRTGTTTQREVVQRGGIFRTVTTTQAQSVSLLRQPRLTRRVTQSQTLRLVRVIAKILATTQAEALALGTRNSSLVLALTQATRATLGRQNATLTSIVLQASNALVIIQAQLARAVQQAAENLTLTIGGQVVQRTASSTQATNVSLTKQPFVTGLAPQAQAVSLLIGAGTRLRTVSQAQVCTLIVQRIPSTPIAPVRVFSACHTRRLVYAAPARQTTFQVRPRETVFVARFS